MLSEKDRTHIFYESRDKEGSDNEHVVKDKDKDESGQHHHHCHHHCHHNHRKERYLRDTVALQRDNRHSQ